PDRIEAGVAEDLERSIAVTDAADEEWLAAHPQRVAELDGCRPAGSAHGRNQRPDSRAGDRARRRLKRSIVEQRSSFHVVDPQLGLAWATVNVEHQAVEVSVGKIDGTFELGLHELLLLVHELHGAAQLQPLPASDAVVKVAAHHG